MSNGEDGDGMSPREYEGSFALVGALAIGGAAWLYYNRSTHPCSDVECGPGEICEMGECVVVNPCIDVECGDGEVCVDGDCLALDPCSGVECGDGMICSGGNCVEAPTDHPCENVTCGDGEVCDGSTGDCVVVDPCAGVDCGDGEVCANGECVELDPCFNVDCGADAECIDGDCVPIDPCEGVSCGAGEECQDGQCVPVEISGPVGGGDGYTNTHTTGDYVVSTPDGLEDALADAQPGEVVFVDGEINMLDREGILVPEGVTLASNRGVDGAPGGMLLFAYSALPATFDVAGVVEGLRARGPRIGFTPIEDRYPATRAFNLLDGGEVANCELFNFGDGSIVITGSDALVRFSHIHSAEVEGIGYGVRSEYGGSTSGRPVIEYCYMHTCRHEISVPAGLSGYVARFNLVDADNFENPTGNLMQQDFDQHESGQNPVHDIHHNTFVETGHDNISLDDTSSTSEIHHNWFYHTDPDAAMSTDDGTFNANVHDNHFGSSDPGQDFGHPR